MWQVFHTDISCFADLRTAISGRISVRSRQEPISGGFLVDDVAKNTCQFEGPKRPAGKSVCQVIRARSGAWGFALLCGRPSD